MNIYLPPTWLYVKKHNVTGLLYFGRTQRTDPIKYIGSGNYWRRHLKKHGRDVTTLWCQLYTDRNSIIRDATEFSIYHDIIKSPHWANLMIEDGINGSAKGRTTKPCNTSTKQKISKALRGKRNGAGHIKSEESKKRISDAIKNLGPRSQETKEKLRLANKGKKLSEETRRKIGLGGIGRKCPKTLEHRRKLSEANKGKVISEEIKKKISETLKNMPQQVVKCEHCGKETNPRLHARWHGNRCKENGKYVVTTGTHK